MVRFCKGQVPCTIRTTAMIFSAGRALHGAMGHARCGMPSTAVCMQRTVQSIMQASLHSQRCAFWEHRGTEGKLPSGDQSIRRGRDTKADQNGEEEQEDLSSLDIDANRAFQAFLRGVKEDGMIETLPLAHRKKMENKSLAEAFSKAEREIAREWFGLKNPTDEELKEVVTDEALEAEISYMYPDSRPKPRVPISTHKHESNLYVGAAGRPTSSAYFTGAWHYVDMALTLQEKLADLESAVLWDDDSEAEQEKVPHIQANRWFNREAMEGKVKGKLTEDQYDHLIFMLKALASHRNAVQVMDYLKGFQEIPNEKQLAYKRAERDDTGAVHALGKRKAAVAEVWLTKGSGCISINGAPLHSYFSRIDDRKMLLEPFLATETLGMYDLVAKVSGGGPTGQSQAIRHGLALALEYADSNLQPVLYSLRLTRRDPRRVERKKPGQKKARKKFTWVKR